MPHVRTFEGKLANQGDRLAIDEADKRHLFLAPRTPLVLTRCRARITTHDDRVELIELIDENCPYKEIGPIESITGTFRIEMGAPHTKMAGSRSVFFDAEDGERYGVLEHVPKSYSLMTIRARKLVANMAYAARSTERDLWILPP